MTIISEDYQGHCQRSSYICRPALLGEHPWTSSCPIFLLWCCLTPWTSKCSWQLLLYLFLLPPRHETLPCENIFRFLRDLSLGLSQWPGTPCMECRWRQPGRAGICRWPLPNSVDSGRRGPWFPPIPGSGDRHRSFPGECLTITSSVRGYSPKPNNYCSQTCERNNHLMFQVASTQKWKNIFVGQKVTPTSRNRRGSCQRFSSGLGSSADFRVYISVRNLAGLGLFVWRVNQF